MTTAVLAPMPPPLIGGCPKRWCLAAYGCDRDDPGSLRLHEGRTSSLWTLDRETIDVTPNQLDEQDGTTYTGPLVTIRLDGEQQRVNVDMTAATGIEFATALASFAAGEAPVGATAAFQGGILGEVRDSTLTIRRIDDVTFVWGNTSDKTWTLGAIEISAHDPDGGEGTDYTVNLDAANAAAFARYVVAAAVEVAG